MTHLKQAFAAVSICALVACSALLAACSTQSGQEQPQYSDEAFMQSLAKGYEARDAIVEKSTKTDKSVEYYESLVDAELKQVEQYQGAQFEDSRLQENAISYINSLKDQRAAAEEYSTDNDNFKKDWQKAYDKRTTLLKTFVEDYGLTVSSSCQDSLNDLISHGKKVERENNEKAAVESLANSINLEFTERYSTFAGEATAANNTGYDFDYISFNVELFDANGVKVETTGIYANHWLNGETIVLSCYTSQKEAPATVKVVANNYKIADAA